jgi:hypothetical protein
MQVGVERTARGYRVQESSSSRLKCGTLRGGIVRYEQGDDRVSEGLNEMDWRVLYAVSQGAHNEDVLVRRFGEEARSTLGRLRAGSLMNQMVWADGPVVYVTSLKGEALLESREVPAGDCHRCGHVFAAGEPTMTIRAEWSGDPVEVPTQEVKMCTLCSGTGWSPF